MQEGRVKEAFYRPYFPTSKGTFARQSKFLLLTMLFLGILLLGIDFYRPYFPTSKEVFDRQNKFLLLRMLFLGILLRE